MLGLGFGVGIEGDLNGFNHLPLISFQSFIS